jgi:hypothetical protein
MNVHHRSTRPMISVDRALLDRNLLGAAFGDPSTWKVWLSVLRASSGLPLDPKQREAFALVAGGRSPPRKRVRESWYLIGRGGGKSKVAAAKATHAALLQQHKLSRGEEAFVLTISPTLSQSQVVHRYVLAFIEASPLLRNEVVGITRTEIRLRNHVTIAMHPCSFRSVRGRAIVSCVLDEAGFFRDETSATPDVEIYRAILPSLIRTGGELTCISTPYRRAGLLYEKHRDYYGVDDDDVLIVQGSSRTFNQTLSEADIAAASAADPEAARSEWDASFRDDLAAFLSEADITAVIDHDRPLELPPRPELRYSAFVDPSGGRHDAFALSISHAEGSTVVIDLVRAKHPPFDPSAVVEEYASLLGDYRIREVTGDAYAAAWVETAFKSAGIRYRCSEQPKSQLYLEGLVNFTRRTLRLPDHPRLLRELRLLERRTHLGGKDSVDHGRTGSDDLANAVFGAIVLSATKKKPIHVSDKALARSRIYNRYQPVIRY